MMAGRSQAGTLARAAWVVGLGGLGVVVAALAFWSIGPELTPTPDPWVEAAKPLVAGQVANFILYDVPGPASAIAFTDEAGRPKSIEDFRGQAVLVNFWATWCVPCKREMPSLDRLQAALGSPEFQVLPLSQDRIAAEKVRAFYTETEISALPLYVDPTGASQRAFLVTGLPATVLIDASGRVVGRMIGPAEWDSPEAIALLRHFSPSAR